MNTLAETTHHDRLQASLDLAGIDLRASEVHGMVCGEICRELRLGSDPAFGHMVGAPESGAGRAVLDTLDALMGESRRALDAGVGFELLLPDDDDPIEERTGSLADWARGFSVALLRGGRLGMDDLDANSAEILRDMLKISEAEPGDGDEADERALMEIEEYLRVGVQVVFEELQPDDPNATTDRGLH